MWLVAEEEEGGGEGGGGVKDVCVADDAGEGRKVGAFEVGVKRQIEAISFFSTPIYLASSTSSV